MVAAEWPSRFVQTLMLASALIAVAVTRSLPMWMAARPDRTAFAYEGANGATYPYLIGQDSYSWVRKARNYLTTGSPCDVRTADDCRDLLRHAPVGSTMPYADSLHVEAIAWLHRLLALFDPTRPLEASAFWLQVVVGTLGVIPTWLVGRRLGGPWGGFVAAILVGLNREFFSRSLGADNDVWNVVLPLCAAAALLRALDDAPLLPRLGWMALAVAFIVIHAAIWSGWVFGFVVLAAGAVACALWTAVGAAPRGGVKAALSKARPLALVAACFLGLGLLLAGLHGRVWGPGRGRATVAATLGRAGERGEPPVDDLRAAEFPNGLRYVGELRVAAFPEVRERLGGWILVFGGVLGLVLVVVPTRTVPPGAAATRAGIVVAVWLAAALYQSLGGQRWIMLAVTPVGLAYAGCAGRVVELVRGRVPWRIAPWLVLAAVAMSVGPWAQAGVLYARAAVPDLTHAWWDSLRDLRANAPPGAIVDAWWPYGYWIEYAAERGVSADGSSLLKRIPHWLGKALLASDVDQTLGLLRMLNCGSDAAPEPEGRLGAYERLRAAGVDGLGAYDLVLELARLDRPAADRLLADRGLPAERRAEILEATHCVPPPAYLVLSDRQTRQIDVMYEATWDPRRAAVARHLRSLPEAEAVKAMTSELGFTDERARATYAVARTLGSTAEIERFIAPGRLYSTAWVPCAVDGATTLVCDVNLHAGNDLTLERFTISAPPGVTATAMLRFRQHGRSTEVAPEAWLIADAGRVAEIDVTGSSAPGYAVLVDAVRSRAIVGPPDLIRSTLTRLTMLDDRPLRGFEKVGEREAAGERVITWRIVWPSTEQ